MAKARMITASVELAPLIDKGAVVKKSLDDLAYTDKAIKVSITESYAGSFQDEESSIRIAGEKSAAMITRRQSVEVDAAKAADFAVIRAAAKMGDSRISLKRSLKLGERDIERAAAILEAAGIKANVEESVGMKPDDYRSIVRGAAPTPEAVALRTAVAACATVADTFAVKYEDA